MPTSTLQVNNMRTHDSVNPQATGVTRDPGTWGYTVLDLDSVSYTATNNDITLGACSLSNNAGANIISTYNNLTPGAVHAPHIDLTAPGDILFDAFETLGLPSTTAALDFSDANLYSRIITDDGTNTYLVIRTHIPPGDTTSFQPDSVSFKNLNTDISASNIKYQAFHEAYDCSIGTNVLVKTGWTTNLSTCSV